MSIQLEFVGHACFRLWQNGRSLIVMDPWNHSKVHLADDGFRLEADTVIVSSLTDPAHDNVNLVRGNPRVINALDVARGLTKPLINGEPVVAVAAAEIPNHPEGTDDNALYAFKAGELWFLHMGDLGYGLSADELAPFAGRCHVLMAIVGEKNTLKLDELDPMIEFLQPTWVVPMHYELPPIAGGMAKVNKFLERRSRDPVIYIRHHTAEFPLPTFELGRPTVVVLQPSGYQPSCSFFN